MGAPRGRTPWLGWFAWALVGFDLFVLAWLFVSSLKSSREIFEAPWSLPAAPQWQNYAAAWGEGRFGLAAFNSVALAVATALATVAVAAPAAYALARFGLRASGWLTTLFALGIGIPAQVIMLPLYAAMDTLGLVDSLPGLWLLYLATSIPFAVFFLTGFFATLPVEMEEAAALDGASPLRCFVSVMLPMARSGIVTLLILNLIAHWNETLFALIFLQSDDKATLPLALLKFLQTMQYNAGNWGGLFAGMCIVVLPVLGIYIWLGSRIIKGFTLGSGK
jgi:multiple sugar transport system permease protein/N-acetylglucosamine transport system permease protein